MTDSPTPVSARRRRRLLWAYLPLLAAGWIALRSLGATWYTFAFSGDVQATWGANTVRGVTAHETIDASTAASRSGQELFGQPRAVALVLVAVVLCAAAVALRTWLLGALGAIVVVPMAWRSLAAMRTALETGPGGEYLTPGPGLLAAGRALPVVAVCLVLALGQVYLVRRAELAEARAAAVARGEAPAPTLAEVVHQAVNARLLRQRSQSN